MLVTIIMITMISMMIVIAENEISDLEFLVLDENYPDPDNFVVSPSMIWIWIYTLKFRFRFLIFDFDFDFVPPSMMRCRSFLLVLSSANTRSSDGEDKVRKNYSGKSEPNIARKYLATNICITAADCVL